MSEELKKCQFCGEEILEIAKKCKHCNSNLDETVVESEGKGDYGLILLGIPIISTLLIIFWIGNMSLLDRPSNSLMLIGLATIIGTASIAGLEASKHKMSKESGGDSPGSYFTIILLLWVVGYPMYLYKRSKYGLKNYVWAGLLVGLIFVVLLVSMNDNIESKKREVRGRLENVFGGYR